MNPSLMKAAVLSQPGKLRVEDRPYPSARPGWVVITVEAAGICGTDVAIYQGTHPANLPIIMGHEFSGRVHAIGKGVTGLQIGQPVMAQGGWTSDETSESGETISETPGSDEMLGRSIDGCFAEAVTVPADIVHPLLEGVSFLAAQSATTLATSIHACERAGNLSGKRVAIIGPGHAGLLLLQVCLYEGAEDVVALDLVQDRLTKASALGASEVVNVQASDFEAWREAHGQDVFDVVFEASGTPSGLAEAFLLVRPKGFVVSYGIISKPLTDVDGYSLYAKELTVLGSKGAGGRYPEAIQLIAQKHVQIEPLVSHCYPLREAKEAFSLVLNRLENSIRVVLIPEGAGIEGS